MKVRSSLVLSVGDDLDRIARLAQDTIGLRWPKLAPVVAFLNIQPDGTVVRRQDGESQAVGRLELEGVAGSGDPGSGVADEGGISSEVADDGAEPSAYSRNYAALAGEHADLLSALRPVVADVRSQQKLVRLQRDEGWEDSGRLFVYVLADSFGPLASVLPLALLKALGERRGKLGSGFELSMSVLYFLPGLFLTSESDEGRRALVHAVARSHATLSEMEGALYPDKPAPRAIPCRVWVAGSVDRQGAVADFASVAKPATHFVARLIDGSLGDDRRWDNEFAHATGQRRTFLSSFGFAELYFPRPYLTGVALATARRRLHRHLSAGAAPDPDAVSSEVQGWLGETGIDDVLGRLQSPKEGKLVLHGSDQRAQLEGPARAVVLREPEQPHVEPNELLAGEYAQEVARKVEADARWGALVRKAGDRLFEACLAKFRDELARRLDSPAGGLAAGTVFCNHVSGTGRGLTEALVGAEVRNLDSLVFDVQCRLARQAGMDGDAERIKRLKVVEIPGKEQAVESAQRRIKAEGERLSKLRSNTGTTRRRLRQKSAKEPREDSRVAEIENRIRALESDVEQYEEELAVLRAECAEEESKVAEQRRMARDPSRRHLLLARLLDAEAQDREEDQRQLHVVAGRHAKALEKYLDVTSVRTRKSRDAVQQAAACGPLVLLVYVALILTGAVDFSLGAAGLLLLLGFALPLFFHARAVWKLWATERKAWGKLLEAKEAVMRAARRLWTRQVRGLRRRFAFLVHAEAIRVLDRLRDEVAAEGARIHELESRIREYGQSVEEDAAALHNIAPDQDPDYHRESVLTTGQADALIRDSKRLDRDVGKAVAAVARSAVVQEARENESASDLGPSVTEAEAEIRRAVDNVLDDEHVATVLERALASDNHDDVRRLWHGVQHAARAQVGLHPDGNQGVVRNLFLVPPDSSSALKAHLKENVVADGSVTWTVADRDYIGICKTVMAFRSCQVAELAMPKRILDDHWDHVCAHSGVLPFSLPAHEALAHVEDEDALVVLQAAVAYLNAGGDGKGVGPIRRLTGSRGSGAKSSRTPKELLADFQSAEELPPETVEELAEQLRARCASRKDDAERLRRFKDEVPTQRRLMLEFLMERRR